MDFKDESENMDFTDEGETMDLSDDNEELRQQEVPTSSRANVDHSQESHKNASPDDITPTPYQVLNYQQQPVQIDQNPNAGELYLKFLMLIFKFILV